MQRKAMMISIAIHLGILALLLLPSSTESPSAARTERAPARVLRLSMVAPPSRRTRDRSLTVSRASVPTDAPAPVDVPAVPNSLVVEIDRAGFGNVFAAAAGWHAELRSGVPYNDPAAFQVFFCRAEDYGELKGRYEGGDAVWFSFPMAFKERILSKSQEYMAATQLSTPPSGVVIGFTSAAPDYFDVRILYAGPPRRGACS